MIPILAFATLAVQQGGLFSRVVPQPTGHNGYEEYVRAAEMLANDAGRAYAITDGSTTPPDDAKPEVVALYRRLSRMPPLDRAREAVQKVGLALTLVDQGNHKIVTHPRGAIAPDTPLPEFFYFKRLGAFHLVAAKVQAADGRTDLAVETLLDGMIFADTVGRFLIIGSLVGSSMENAVYKGFADLLPRLSRRDAVSIQSGVASLLAQPSSIEACVKTETEMVSAGLGMLFREGPKLSSIVGNDYPANGPLRGIEKLSEAGRADLKREAAAELKAKSAAMLAILKKPEWDWIPAFAQMDEENALRGTNLAEDLVRALSPVYAQFAVANIRSRTQLRLLALHARLVQHRWDYGRWPATLDDVDPLTGGKYVYERSEDGTIRVASRGTPETGEIELKYKRPLGNEKAEP